MSTDVVDPSWMDEDEPGTKPGITCHIEIDNESCETMQEAVATTVAALRTIALKPETGTLDDGHQPIQTPRGVKIGTVYLDFYAMM